MRGSGPPLLRGFGDNRSVSSVRQARAMCSAQCSRALASCQTLRSTPPPEQVQNSYARHHVRASSLRPQSVGGVQPVHHEQRLICALRLRWRRLAMLPMPSQFQTRHSYLDRATTCLCHGHSRAPIFQTRLSSPWSIPAFRGLVSGADGVSAVRSASLPVK